MMHKRKKSCIVCWHIDKEEPRDAWEKKVIARCLKVICLYMDFPKALETFLSSSIKNQSRNSKIGKIEADSDSVYCSQTDVD